MKPILYSDTETAFDTNGLGVLSDAMSSIVKQKLNGMYELTLKYPVHGIRSELIKDRCIILAKPDPVSKPQPFRIYHIVPASSGIIKVYARHIAYDLMGITVSPFTANGAADAMQRMKDKAVVACPFSFYTDKTVATNFKVEAPKSVWDILGGTEGSLLDVYGGEYEFDRYTIRLITERGTDRGVTIRYAKNLKTLEQDRSCDGCYTGVHPYWRYTDEESTTLIQLPEKIVNVEGNFNYTRILALDLSTEWDEAPTEEQLRERTKRYIKNNNIGVPDISWTVSFAALEQTEEYKGLKLLESVYLGDTVTVVFPDLNIYVSARAVEIEFDSILERYNDVTLGKVRSSFTDTVIKQQQELAKKPSYDAVKRAAEVATKLILGAKGGAVRLLDTDGDGQPDTLYVADNNDPALAKKVWRWNYEGWGASTNGFNGPFTMAATLEAGLLAEFVTAAHLTAGTIQSQNGSIFIDLDSGTFRAKEVEEVSNSVNSLEKDLDATNSNLKNNYSTTVQMESAIKAAADGINLSVSKSYVTTAAYDQGIADAKEAAAEDATSKANAAQSSAIAYASGRASAAEKNAKDAAIKHTDDTLKNYSTTVQMEAAIKVVADQITSKVSKGDVESIISQKADSIRLRASKISWNSTYSSMTEDGELTCSNANIKGIIECGDENWYWMRLGNAGKLEGGYGGNQVGTVNCADFTGGMWGMGIKSENIIFDGDIWVYSMLDGMGCWSRGTDGWVTVVSELSIEPYGDGGVQWSYSFKDLEFQHGICVTIL